MTRTRLANSIRRFGELEWDSVAGTELMMSHRWQRVMEACRPDYRPRYALIEDQEGPLACVVTAGSSPPIAPGNWQQRLAGRLTVTIGAPFSARARGIAVRPGASLAAVLPTIEPALAKLCLLERRPLLGVTNVLETEVATFRERGFKVVARPPTMVLDLNGDSYDDYLRRLPKADRAEIRRARRRAAEHQVELECGPIRPASEALYPLFVELCAQHSTRPPVTAGFFAALAAEMPRETNVVSGSVDGQPAGFVLCFIQHDTLIAPVIGLRYELSRPSCLYQVLIDEMVRWSLKHGLRYVHLGLGNERQKRRHGFVPQSRFASIRAPLIPRLPERNRPTCTSLESVDTTTPLPRF